MTQDANKQFYDRLNSDNRQSLPLRALVTSTPQDRDPALYGRVVDQFIVEQSARYKPTPGTTWCNIFVWDVTSAMGQEVPHWIDIDNRPADPHSPGARETTANMLADWFDSVTARNRGWREVSRTGSQDEANSGRPVVAAWKAPPGKHGHVAMVRPAVWVPQGPTVAQAGAINFSRGLIGRAFGVREPRFFANR